MKDLVSAIIAMDKDIIGGDTVFYDGVKSSDFGSRTHILKHLLRRMVFGPFEKAFHEGTLWSGYRAVISFILTKFFPTFLSPWESVLWPISKFISKKKYIDDDGSEEKPKFVLQRRLIKYSCYDPIQAMFDRDRKEAKYNFGKKRKATGCIFLPGSGLREDEGNLKMRSCLQYAVINSAPGIGKYI